MNTIKNILFSLVLLITCRSATGQTHSTANFPIDSAMNEYLWIKNGLIKDNIGIVNAHAKNLVIIITKASITTERTAQSSLLTKVLTEANFIANGHDIITQRAHFINLSAGMYDLIKTTGMTGMAVVQRYCPMNKATWLSDDGDNRNPYFGNAMATCGRLLVTIPANKKP